MLFRSQSCEVSRADLRAPLTVVPSARRLSLPALMSSGLLLCAVALGTASTTASATSDALTPEQDQFIAARKALDAGELARFETLSSGLTDYPIYRYLEYEKLKRDFKREVDRSAIGKLNQFEQRFKDEDLTRRLTRQLQKRFVEQEDWEIFLALSRSRVAATMDCALTRARFETGQLTDFDETATDLWIRGRTKDSVCESTIATLEARSIPGFAAMWERIFTAIEDNRFETAEAMLGLLASADRKRVKRWIDSVETPETLLQSKHVKADTVLNRRMIQDLLWRWSREDTEAAINHWQKIRHQYAFYQDERYDLSRKLSLRAAYRRMPQAPGWLQGFKAREDDLELQEWRVRATLLLQDWPMVLQRIAELPEEEQQEDHWAYWVARSHEMLGDQASADTIYRELAELQSYHGFLSADRLGLPYRLYDEPIDVATDMLAQLRELPVLVRAREYHRVHLAGEARREWHNALSGFEQDEIAASAIVAAEWQMHDRAVLSAGRAEARRALRYRFPVLYEAEVLKAAQKSRIEPALIYGVIRRESAFIADIKSSAGAVGLMQLMPRTARYVADLQGEKNWKGDLTDESVNIDFGAFYMRHVLNRFEDNQVLALASYNAGPHRVKQWLPPADMPADVWIDTIPFTETRRYARAVLAYSLIFEWRLTGDTTPMSARMDRVEAAPVETAEENKS
ncbi:MAG: lytic transglycosylase domain-containing protein [Gammaproteobacteria bacterium]|nr:lytic transglycosylase domain-containing protein [Gammaproteobacteria bacterium]